ncbi:TetR/AcrR family transcriptional regulator [Rhodococcus erythropolis]
MGHQTPAEVEAGLLRPPSGARSDAAHEKALRSAVCLLKIGGMKAATIDAISEQSGVSKVTLYRHWPSRQAIAAEAFGVLMARHLTFPETDSAQADLNDYLDDIGKFYRGPLGSIFVELVGACANDATTAAYFRTFFLDERRRGFADLIQRCVESEYFRDDIDTEQAIDLFFGPLVYRMLVGHASIDDRALHSIIDHAIRGLRKPV